MKAAVATPPESASVDHAALEQHVRAMYERVASDPGGEFHFELGRADRSVRAYGVQNISLLAYKRQSRSPLPSNPAGATP
jgi:hypothetical protein